MKPRFFPTPADFRAWLQKNHDKADELWVGYYRKAAGKPSVTWPETVDEALCFGWIDGLRKRIDEESYRIRFTPRRPGSNWSKRNIGRVEAMIAAGKMTPAGLKAYKALEKDGSKAYGFGQEEVELDEAYAEEIRKNEKAREYWENGIAPFAKRISTWFVMSAKRESTRERRLAAVIKAAEQGMVIKELRKR